MPTKDDAELLHKALTKIVAAQRRGSLSTVLSYTRRSSTIYVEPSSMTAKDIAWFEKNFPKSRQHGGGYFRSGRKPRRGEQRYDVLNIEHDLRLKSGARYAFDFPPKVSYSVLVPHQHLSVFSTHHTSMPTPPVWRCASCQQALTKTEARALGLIPPRPDRKAK